MTMYFDESKAEFILCAVNYIMLLHQISTCTELTDQALIFDCAKYGICTPDARFSDWLQVKKR